MSSELTIRPLQAQDMSGLLAVYAPYVLHTAITFDYEVPSLEEFTHKLDTITAQYPCLVCVQGEEVVGYAYASTYRVKAAYQWSPESTIYLAEGVHRKGIARILYQALFDILHLQGFINVYAGVTIPNAKSEGLHRTLGFEEIGIFEKIGYKHDKWHDLKWFQLILSEHAHNPQPPADIQTTQASPAFKAILDRANERLKEKV